MCIIVHNRHTQYSTEQIFLLVLQTVITAQVLPIGGEGNNKSKQLRIKTSENQIINQNLYLQHDLIN